MSGQLLYLTVVESMLEASLSRPQAAFSSEDQDRIVEAQKAAPRWGGRLLRAGFPVPAKLRPLVAVLVPLMGSETRARRAAIALQQAAGSALSHVERRQRFGVKVHSSALPECVLADALIFALRELLTGPRQSSKPLPYVRPHGCTTRVTAETKVLSVAFGVFGPHLGLRGKKAKQIGSPGWFASRLLTYRKAQTARKRAVAWVASSSGPPPGYWRVTKRLVDDSERKFEVRNCVF